MKAVSFPCAAVFRNFHTATAFAFWKYNFWIKVTLWAILGCGTKMAAGAIVKNSVQITPYRRKTNGQRRDIIFLLSYALNVLKGVGNRSGFAASMWLATFLLSKSFLTKKKNSKK